ncbi:hypothetical protein [Microlunatus speluncae]|uniref:hypothetical protein n=1 Tax=Microlunatus speluncae TaxID=2594267 RepID=UPI0012666AAA|nr:hypothetical protein [Microlunatus speluncae]
MQRRTVLKLAAGVAGAAAVGSAVRAGSAVAAGRFTDLAGWPVDARFDAIATGRSGSWAIGMQRLADRPDGSWQRRAILRRLCGGRWVPVPLPDDFAAWAHAITPDPTGVWIVADRNERSLPVADGSIVVGHLGLDGHWRTLDTDRLPAYCGFSSLALIDGRIELTGYAPTEGDGRPRPYCLTRPLHGAASWTERPVEAPVWAGDVVPSLTIGAGTTDWATADTWLFRRSGSGWALAEGPPGGEGQVAWQGPCAVGGRSLYLSTAYPEAEVRHRLHRRVAGTWTEVKLPAGVGIHAFVPTADGCWAFGDRYVPEPEAITAIALWVVGAKVVQRIDGPAGAADGACRADGRILVSGIVPDPRDPEWGDWFGHAWSLRG